MPNSTNDRLIELMAMKSRMLSGGDSDAEVLDGAAENRSGRAASDLIGNVEAIARELSLDVTDVIAGRRSLPSYTKSIEQLRELAAADVSLTNEFNLGLGLGLRSQYEESTEILRRAFSAYPDAPVEMKLYLALILIRARRLDEAKELLTSQIVRYPDLGYAHYLMGLALHVEWNFAECVNYYRGALDLNPNDKLAGHNIVNGLERFLPAELRFIQHRFFKFDGGDDDRACASVLSESLFSSDKTMAIFGISDLTDYLFSVLPNLSKQISCVVSDDSSLIGSTYNGVTVVSLKDMPMNLDAVFLGSSEYMVQEEMRKNLALSNFSGTVTDLSLLQEVSPAVLHSGAWMQVGTIYPIEMPDFEFESEKDFILLDLPARMQAQLPNGLGYLYEILKNSEIDFQIADTDVIFYHKYHAQRVMDGYETVESKSGYQMEVDPWATGSFTEEWVKPEVLEYFEDEINTVTDRLVEANPKILGISLHQTNIPMAKMIVAEIRKRCPKMVILVGGYDCTFWHVAVKKFPDFDYMCVREADLTIVPLIKSILAGENPKDMRGIVSKYDSPDWEFVGAPQLKILDKLPMPKYDWIKDVAVYTNYSGYRLTPVLLGRGCVWSNCTFCGERFEFRTHTAKRMVDYIEWLMDQGCHLFHFNDSDLNGDPDTVLAMCDEIIARDLKPQMIAQLRVHHRGTREYYQKMRDAGFTNLRFGVDAWSKHTLRLQKKGYTVKRIEENLENCHAAGIHITVNVVCAIPGESEEDFQESVDNLVRFKKYIGLVENINPLMVVAGSLYYEDPEKFGIKFVGDAEELVGRYPGTLPDEYWYSDDPYLGPEERKKRLTDMIIALQEGGYRIGPYAETMVREKTRRLEDAAARVAQNEGYDSAGALNV